jgi:hypothetical protein
MSDFLFLCVLKCYVEARCVLLALGPPAWSCVSVQAQVASSGPAAWGYCQPASNYAELRERMVGAFAEKESQLSDTVAVMLAVSRDLKNELNEIHEKCG